MRFPRPDQELSRNVFGWPSGFAQEVEVQDAHETIRLEVVGLASEVATQATRIEETLCRTDDPAAQGVADRSREAALRAREVLAPHAEVHQADDKVLLEALFALRRDQRAILKLRATADELARTGRAERHTVWAALQAGLAGRRR